MSKTSVSIDILGRTYKINCPEHEVESLQKAAKMLEAKMQDVHDGAKIINFDRVAIIAGLNLAHQILLLEKNNQEYMQSVQQRLQELEGRVDSALTRNEQTEFVSAE